MLPCHKRLEGVLCGARSRKRNQILLQTPIAGQLIIQERLSMGVAVWLLFPLLRDHCEQLREDTFQEYCPAGAKLY